MNVLEATAQVHDVPITVEGTLLVGADSRLVGDYTDPSSPFIPLPHEAVRERLLCHVPPYGGGPYIYAEPATVTGQVVENPWRFSTVSELVIVSDDTTYKFVDVAR
jgi:hypothetical protein